VVGLWGGLGGGTAVEGLVWAHLSGPEAARRVAEAYVVANATTIKVMYCDLASVKAMGVTKLYGGYKNLLGLQKFMGGPTHVTYSLVANAKTIKVRILIHIVYDGAHTCFGLSLLSFNFAAGWRRRRKGRGEKGGGGKRRRRSIYTRS